MKIWSTSVDTEAGDTYLFAFRNEPTREQLAQLVAEMEGGEDEIDFYLETISIDCSEEEVIEN